MPIALEMAEPHRTRFIELLHSGAALQDIHAGAPGEPGKGRASEAFIQRELQRVDSHSRSICSYIDQSRFRSNGRILDAGCGTAALSVALALRFPNARVHAFDANARTVQAAGVRVAAYGLADRVRLDYIAAGSVLPYERNSFGLVTCASVIEFITDASMRQQFLRSLANATSPGGMIVITTPNPLYLRELHTGRFLQNWRGAPDAPWASSRRWISAALRDFDYLSDAGKSSQVLRHRFGRLPASGMITWVDACRPWQFLCYRKREA